METAFRCQPVAIRHPRFRSIVHHAAWLPLTIVLRPKPPLPSEYAYCLARSSGFREFAIQSMTGSSGRQRVPAESLSHYPVVTPSQQIAEQFGHIVGPLFSRASNAVRESRALAALRDSLLPKLVSGDIRMKNAEVIVSKPCSSEVEAIK